MKSLLLVALVSTIVLGGCTTAEPKVEEQDATATAPVVWSAERRDMIDRLRQNPHLSVQDGADEAIHIQIRSGDSFAVGQSSPSETLREVLEHVASSMTALFSTHLHVVGHTDSAGNAANNMALSEARAQAVADYLIELGLDAVDVSHEGKGATEPIASNANREGRAVNRRIEILITKVD